MKTLWYISVIIQLMIFSAIGATAGMCGTRDAFVKALANKYHEAPIGAGMVMQIEGKTTVVELFKSKNGETWSLLVTSPDGKTCIIAVGQNWADVKPEPAGMKS